MTWPISGETSGPPHLPGLRAAQSAQGQCQRRIGDECREDRKRGPNVEQNLIGSGEGYGVEEEKTYSDHVPCGIPTVFTGALTIVLVVQGLGSLAGRIRARDNLFVERRQPLDEDVSSSEKQCPADQHGRQQRRPSRRKRRKRREPQVQSEYHKTDSPMRQAGPH